MAGGGAAGGKGGLIEVSGHDVLLSGEINPGSGGTLLIDPFNVKITPSVGFNNVAGSTVSEAFISNQLGHNIGVSIVATHNVDFLATGANHVLQGGGGNFTVTAGDNILFHANDYEIRTGRGNVTLTAMSGDIGDASHRLSLVSSAPGISQAGDIRLTAGNDMFLGNVTVRSGGTGIFGAGNFHALFSANAGGSFSAAGVIDVGAKAKGSGAQGANAQVHISAGSDLVLHGVKALASASEFGGGGNVGATAHVDLDGLRVVDHGNASAAAVIGGHSGHNFRAGADLTVHAEGQIQIDGNVAVAARGNVFSVDTATVHALAQLEASSGEVRVGNLALEARGRGNKVGFVNASAAADMSGSAVHVAHNALVQATANNANLGRSASANAELVVTAFGGNASFGGDVTVRGTALNGGARRMRTSTGSASTSVPPA